MIMAESLPKWQIRQNLQPNSILLHFLCIPLRFDGQKDKFSHFCFWLWPMFRVAWPSDMHFEKNSWFWPPTVWFISSPEPLGSQGDLIVYPYSGVRCRRRRRRQQCLNIFSSETALPIKAKFYVEPPWEGGTKVCINGPGHMTKMAAMPIYGKNL